jgi:hypothetical protein
MGWQGRRSACPLNLLALVLAEAEKGEDLVFPLREPAQPKFAGWRAWTASRSALPLLAGCIDLVFLPVQPERMVCVSSASMRTRL